MTYEEKRQLYEKIMSRISVNVKRMLNEKYGSAHNNSNIFTGEIKDVIYNVLDSIRDKSYLNWEKINVYEDEVLYNKIFWLNNTDWMEGVQMCIWPGCDRFNNKKAKASYFDGQIEDSGKMTAVINLFNVIPGKCDDMYYDYFIHEFKHAYFDYTKMKSSNRKQSQI